MEDQGLKIKFTVPPDKVRRVNYLRFFGRIRINYDVNAPDDV